jgi:alanyl-tRNA synthetase
LLDEEEVSFARTLDRGEKLFEQYASRAKDQGSSQLSGKDVWRLYDTFGFPVDLTRLMAEELGLGINDAELEEAQAWSKEASKSSAKQAGDVVVKLDVHDIALLEANTNVPKTDDNPKFSAVSSLPTRSLLTDFHCRSGACGGCGNGHLL